MFYIILAMLAAVPLGIIGNHFRQTVCQAPDKLCSGMPGFTALFTSLGIRSEALALATAANSFFESYETGFNMLLLNFRIPCEECVSAGRTAKLC